MGKSPRHTRPEIRRVGVSNPRSGLRSTGAAPETFHRGTHMKDWTALSIAIAVNVGFCTYVFAYVLIRLADRRRG